MTESTLIADARDFFAEADGHESRWREEWRDDLAFRNLDQWSDKAKAARSGTSGGADGGEPARPMLTIDHTDQYIRQIVNDARMNPPALRAVPMDDKADLEVAEALQGMFRYIEATSRAQHAYTTALDWSVTCGRGFFRVGSELVDHERNLYEPRIGRIANALMVYFDPYSVELDGSDADDAMLISVFSKRAFKRKYPGAKATSSWDGKDNDWITSEGIRVAEWHSVTSTESKVIVMRGGKRLTEEEAQKQQPKNFREEVEKRKVCRVRIVTGAEVIEDNEAHCDGVGLIPVYGVERYTDDSASNSRHLRGAIRAAKDPQRLLNFLASNFAEAASGSPRAPWIAAAESIEGYEHLYEAANRLSLGHLPYRRWSPVGPAGQLQENPPPQRMAVDLNLPGYIMGLQSMAGLIQASMGMYQASVGAPGQEKSGVAIRERKSESDVGTFHYNDNLSMSVQQGGRLIMQMIPRLFDVRRVQQVLGEDGEQSQVIIDPNAKQPLSKRKDANGKAMLVLNPSIGEYDIQVAVGPSYTTKRQEAVAQMSDLLSRSPDLQALVGDLFFGAMDFPGAKEIAKRMKLMLPDVVKAAEEAGEDVPAEVTAIVAQLQQIMQQREQGATATMEQLTKLFEQTRDAHAKMITKGADLTVQEANLKVERIELDQVRTGVEQLLSTPVDPITGQPIQQAAQSPQVAAPAEAGPTGQPAPVDAAAAPDDALAQVLMRIAEAQEQTNQLLVAIAQQVLPGTQPDPMSMPAEDVPTLDPAMAIDPGGEMGGMPAQFDDPMAVEGGL